VRTQALYFPFRISTENFAESASESVAQVIAPLKKLLHNTLLDRFVDSLEKLTNPEHRWKDWTEELLPLLRDNRRDAKQLKALFAAIHKDVFDPKQPGLGAYNKKFAAAWESLFKSAFGADGSTLVRMYVIPSSVRACGGRHCRHTLSLTHFVTGNTPTLPSCEQSCGARWRGSSNPSARKR
jgi:hypothetical protein